MKDRPMPNPIQRFAFGIAVALLAAAAFVNVFGL